LWSVGAAATLRAVIRPLAVCLGTAPDVVRLAPVVHELRRRDLPVALVSATRDPETLFPTLATLGLEADLHVPGAAGPAALGDAFERVKPAAVVVQGEAAAAVDGAHAAGARAIPVAHVASPRRPLEAADAFGAEVRRRQIASVARWLFLPGEVPIAGLLRAGVHPTGIAISGATTADAVRWVADRRGLLDRPRTAGPRRVLVVARAHERESDRLRAVAAAVARLAERADVEVVLALDAPPALRASVLPALAAHDNVTAFGAFGFEELVGMTATSHLVLTDAGGVEEVAPALSVPVLVMGDTPARPEGVAAGCARLCGSAPAAILQHAERLLDDDGLHRRMATAPNPGGDGRAARRIVDRLAGDLARGVHEGLLAA
jgi:UDP-N-acetylglucosamine 2-epimerase (non-hydrolysing)